MTLLVSEMLTSACVITLNHFSWLITEGGTDVKLKALPQGIVYPPEDEPIKVRW